MLRFKKRKNDSYSFSSPPRMGSQSAQADTNFSRTSSFSGRAGGFSSFSGNQSRRSRAGSVSGSAGAFSSLRAPHSLPGSTSATTFSRPRMVKPRRSPALLLVALLLCGVILASRFSNTGRPDSTATGTTSVPSPLLPTPDTAQIVSGNSSALTPQKDSVSRFYYSQLLPNEQKVYERIRAGLETRSDSIELSGCTAESINKVYGLICLDYPEYFWCDHSHRLQQLGTGSSATFTVYPGYYYSAAETQRCNTKFEAVAQQAVSPLQGKSDFEKALGVYEFIIDHTIYDFNYSSHSAYQVLVNGRGVCAGYAASTQVLLNRLGIECFIICGYAENSMYADDHAWNMARLDGNWYLIDTTWGDPLTTDGTQVISYKYFCLTSAEMNRNHRPDSGFAYPLCTANACNYYVHEGLFLSSYSHEAMQRICNLALQKRGNIEFRCADRDVYTEAYRDLFDKNYCWELLESVRPGLINPKSLSYAEDEAFLYISFILEYY